MFMFDCWMVINDIETMSTILDTYEPRDDPPMGKLTINGTEINIWHEEYIALVEQVREQRQAALVLAALEEVESMLSTDRHHLLGS